MWSPENQILFYLRYWRRLVFGSKIIEFCAHNVCVLLRPRTIDGYIFNEVFNKQDYLPTRRLDLKNGTFIDLGAQIGLFSIWAHEKYRPNVILCVEPFADNIKLLKRNLLQHAISANIIEKAIYTHNKGAQLQKSRMNTGGHSIQSDGGIAVQTMTLHELLSKITRVDYMKIDIEGSEKYVFIESNMKEIAKKVKFIKMEVHLSKQVSVIDIQMRLEDYGYEVITIPQPKLDFINVVMIEAYKK